MTRPARLVVVAAVAAAVLTGCSEAPVRAGAAAVIGDRRISTQELVQDVDLDLADPAAAQLAADRPAFLREVLTRRITSDLLAAVAARQGVTVTQGEADSQYDALVRSVGGADQLKTQAASAGYTEQGVRELAREQAVRQALGERATAGVQIPQEQLQQAYQSRIDTYDQVRTAQVLLPTIEEAQALLPQAQALDAAGFAALARARSTDESTKEQGGDLGLQPLSAFVSNGLEAYGTAAFGAKVGDTFVAASSRGGHVVRVLERETTTLEEATPELRQSLLQEQQQAAVRDLLVEEAARTSITVSPRFGQWNATDLAVVAREDAGDRLVSSPGPVPGGGADSPAADEALIDPDEQ